jgi:cyclase
MLAKRIIPCLDVKDGKVVKGVKFKNHVVVGEVVELAKYYSEAGADELVFYDITASSERRTVCAEWIKQVAKHLQIPFCVAGGIRTRAEAEAILNAGADKISLNSPALERPDLINELSTLYGKQCIVIGIDSLQQSDAYYVCQYTGNPSKMRITTRLTIDWVQEVQARGAGEIVLNCMNQDGTRQGYDIAQLQMLRPWIKVPLIASGGAGNMQDFAKVIQEAKVEGVLAASVFHNNLIRIDALKKYLANKQIEVRLT